MPAPNSWHPLQIVGLALLTSSLVFAILMFAIPMTAFYGVVVGCAITGLILATVGFGLKKRAHPVSEESR